MNRLVKPNWKKSILNVSATLAEFLGVENKNPILPKLKKELDKGYKNVVCMCWDAMGIAPLKQHLKNTDFLRSNIKQVLTSTFPSTTTSATVTLTSNLFPLEHGWLGWSVHFDEINRNIDLFKSRDSQTKEHIDFNLPLYDEELCFFDLANSEYEINVVAPSYFDTKSKDKMVAVESEEELIDAVEQICNKPNKQFIYAYFDDPDYTMHDFGMTSAEAKEKITKINNLLEGLFNKLEDTLLIILSDHGQTDVAEYIEFYKDKEINDMLLCPPYLDSSAIAFKVKEDKKNEFAKMFKTKYGKDFKLFKSDYLIRKGYFGERGDYGYLLGDFITTSRSNKALLIYENSKRLKGNHSSMIDLTMLIPLIIVGKK